MDGFPVYKPSRVMILKRVASSECELRDPCSDDGKLGTRPNTREQADVIISLNLGFREKKKGFQSDPNVCTPKPRSAQLGKNHN